MANFKKGIALALVATTAFTFAPVANLGTPVVAEAASALIKADDIALVAGDTKTYTVQDLAAYADTDTVTVSSSDYNIVTVSTDAVHQDPQDPTITSGANHESVAGLMAKDTVKLTAGRAGTATITVAVAGKNGDKATETFKVTVEGVATSFTGTVGGKDVLTTPVSATVGNDTTVDLKVKNEKIADVTRVPGADGTDGIEYTVEAVSDDTKIATVSAPTLTPEQNTTDTKGTLKVTGVKAGTTNVTVRVVKKVTDKADVAEPTVTTTIPYTLSFTVNVADAADKVTVTVNGKDTENTGSAAVKDAAQTILLNNTTNTASITAKSAFGYNVVYTATKNDKSTPAGDSALIVDKNGNITAVKDAAGNVKNGTFYIVVTTVQPAGSTAPQTPVSKGVAVKVIVTPKAIAGTSMSVTVDDVTTENTAAVKNSDEASSTTTNASEVILSTKDKTTANVTIASNVSDAYQTVTVDKPSIVKYENGVLTAVKAGTANVTFFAKNNENTLGTATVTVPVKVVDKFANNAITATGVSVTKNSPEATITASSTYKTTFGYRLVRYNATDKKYEATTDNNIFVNASTGVVTYKKTGLSGTAIVEVSGKETAEAVAPTPAYVTVKYSADKDANELVVAEKSVALKAGESAKLNATASKDSVVTFETSDASVATVSEDGVVTAVKAGVAFVTVKAAETENFLSAETIIPVVVTEEAKPVVIAKPAKVKSVTAKAVKGGKVKFTAKKVAKAAGYQFVYTVGKKTVKKTTTKTTLTVKIGKGKKATVKVRAYNYKNGTTKQYGAFSAKKSVKASK
jgi:hypothetical protein